MELIEREAFVEELRKKATAEMDLVDVLSILKDIPAIDAAPVVHGRWEQIRFYREDGFQRWRCTRCKFENVRPNAHFCPNCGARMDGGERQ